MESKENIDDVIEFRNQNPILRRTENIVKDIL